MAEGNDKRANRGPPNYVHNDLIFRDNVNKEETYLMINRNEHYQVNPYACNIYMKLLQKNY